MRVISVIEDFDVTKKILKHLGLWTIYPTSGSCIFVAGMRNTQQIVGLCT